MKHGKDGFQITLTAGLSLGDEAKQGLLQDTAWPVILGKVGYLFGKKNISFSRITTCDVKEMSSTFLTALLG